MTSRRPGPQKTCLSPFGWASAALAIGLWASAAASAFTLEFPGPATPTAKPAAARGSYAMPVGRWTKDGIPARVIDGLVERSAWQIDTPKLSSLDLMQPLRAQLVVAGFKPVFDCETQGCGGFDFRFAIDVLPEPQMHVDLGDFRFFTAERKTQAGVEAVGLLVSRSASMGFVQLTRVVEGGGLPLFAATNKADEGLALPLEDGTTAAGVKRPALLPVPDAAIARLVNTGAVVLEGLDFGSGSTDLTEGRYASLAALAEWLTENPDKSVVLVGHTDASGGLDGNIVISKRRAASVRRRLIEAYGIPSAQIEAQGVGYLSPIDTNLTEEGRQKNRRVEAILTSTQ
ncbi:MAG: OmpA family protein [Pseudorhodobacter sp.]